VDGASTSAAMTSLSLEQLTQYSEGRKDANVNTYPKLCLYARSFVQLKHSSRGAFNPMHFDTSLLVASL